LHYYYAEKWSTRELGRNTGNKAYSEENIVFILILDRAPPIIMSTISNTFAADQQICLDTDESKDNCHDNEGTQDGINETVSLHKKIKQMAISGLRDIHRNDPR